MYNNACAYCVILMDMTWTYVHLVGLEITDLDTPLLCPVTWGSAKLIAFDAVSIQFMQQNITKQNKTKQNKTKQNKTKQNKTKQKRKSYEITK